MSAVRVEDLGGYLTEYLRSVRDGETVVVVDRKTPIARIVPFESPTRNP
jgi:prevent-host-death family protein